MGESMVGIIIAVVSASLSYIYTKHSQRRQGEARLKEKCYLEYIEALSNNVLTDNIEEGVGKLADVYNKILLIGSSRVVSNLMEFHKFIAVDNNESFTIEEHDLLLTQLIKSMRADLYKERNVNSNYPTVSLSGREEDIRGKLDA